MESPRGFAEQRPAAEPDDAAFVTERSGFDRVTFPGRSTRTRKGQTCKASAGDRRPATSSSETAWQPNGLGPLAEPRCLVGLPLRSRASVPLLRVACARHSATLGAQAARFRAGSEQRGVPTQPAASGEPGPAHTQDRTCGEPSGGEQTICGVVRGSGRHYEGVCQCDSCRE
jgi:hypothetical protein